MTPLDNILTVDLEEWFVVEVLRDRYTMEDWPSLPSRLVQNTRKLLKLFSKRDAQATFFVLGWCAEKHPELIREIANEGHEIACHSYAHQRVDSLTPERFKEDTIRAIDMIMKSCDHQPIGYRAPSWSINTRIPWAFEILGELGFHYDSSIFPIKHDLYGSPDDPRYTFKMALSGNRVLYEIPASTVRLFGKNFPISGGGYLRHSPYWFSRKMIQTLNQENVPAMIYLHPWEIDPDPPRVPGLTGLRRFRAYSSTDIFGLKLDRMLSEFSFTTVSGYLADSTRKRIGFEKI